MNQDLGLKILGRIMNWTDGRAREEFAWLKLMARLKYDGYHDFQAGMRFIESLVTWLQQFKPHERETAYAFVRRSLVYIGPSEMQRLVEQFYPHFVRDRLVRMVATEHGVPPHRVLIDPNVRAASERLRRQTLFMGLSDGARIDTIRHANSGLLGNEQFVQGTQVDADKWRDLLDNLRKDLDDPNARFRIVYLVDDFAGTGTSFLRFDAKAAKWKGKLVRFKDSVNGANGAFDSHKLFEDGWVLCVHHYVASSAAAGAIQKRLKQSADTGDFSRRLGPTNIRDLRHGPSARPSDRHGRRAPRGLHRIDPDLLRPGYPDEAHRRWRRDPPRPRLRRLRAPSRARTQHPKQLGRSALGRDQWRHSR